MRQLCERKGVEIIEAEACKDHIHMLVSIPSKLGVSSFVGYLKGKSSLMIFDRHANLKYRYGNRKFWCKGFYVDTVGRNKKVIENYIRNQLQEDIVAIKFQWKNILILLQEKKLKRRKIVPLRGAGKVVQLADLSAPFWPVRKEGRRTNHPFTRVVLI